MVVLHEVVYHEEASLGVGALALAKTLDLVQQTSVHLEPQTIQLAHIQIDLLFPLVHHDYSADA